MKLRIPAPSPGSLQNATKLLHTCLPYLPEMEFKNKPAISGLIKIRAWDWRTCDHCLADTQDQDYRALLTHLRREENLCFVLLNDAEKVRKLRKRITENKLYSVEFRLRTFQFIVLTNAPQKGSIRDLKKAKNLCSNRVDLWLHSVIYRGTNWRLPKGERPIRASNRWKIGDRPDKPRYQRTGGTVKDDTIKNVVAQDPDLWDRHLRKIAEITGVSIGATSDQGIPFFNYAGLSAEVLARLKKAQGIDVELPDHLVDGSAEEIFDYLLEFAEEARSLIDEEADAT